MASGGLREREQRMALAIEGSGTGIWDRNLQSGVIHYSAGWKALLGYSEHELSNRIEDSYTRVHPDDLPQVMRAMQDHIDQLSPAYSAEYRIRCKDLSYKWVASRGKVVEYDDLGRSLRMIGTTTDITALRTMSEQLRESMELITRLTDAVPGLVFQYRRHPDGTDQFSYASKGILDIYELSPEDVAHHTTALEARIHPDDLALYRDSLRESASTLASWHVDYRVQLPRQGLRWRQANARPQRLEDGTVLWHGLITDVTARKRAEEELKNYATVDALTGLSNRRYFIEQMQKQATRLRDTRRTCAVLMCDLDHFKAINDSWGHATGDKALSHFAAVLRGQLDGPGDVGGRLGGEEFAVLLRDTDARQALNFAQRLRDKLAQSPLHDNGRTIRLTASIGVAILTSADEDALAALSRSDSAMYRAKSLGRDRCELA